MPKLKSQDVAILKAVEKNFFDVVPQKFETFCAFNAKIIEVTLGHFNIPAKAEPCQLWCATPSNNFIVGFIHENPKPDKWDGHAICVAGDWLMDAGLSHLRRDHGLAVPPIAVIPRFQVRSQTLARADISATERIWWMRPPADINAALPDEPQDLVKSYSSALIRKIEIGLASLATVVCAATDAIAATAFY